MNLHKQSKHQSYGNNFKHDLKMVIWKLWEIFQKGNTCAYTTLDYEQYEKYFKYMCKGNKKCNISKGNICTFLKGSEKGNTTSYAHFEWKYNKDMSILKCIKHNILAHNGGAAQVSMENGKQGNGFI